ncbi:MAG: MBL fold metallo-hydrolase [Sulfolobales archaeon]
MPLQEIPAHINSRGGVVINNKIVADGFENTKYRFISHAHSDHTLDLGLSIRSSQIIYAHKATFEILEVLEDGVPRYLRNPMNYGDRICIDDDCIEIVEARHILGSAQLVYSSPRAGTIVYTGDFKDPGRGTKIISGADIVITEATYGSPAYVRRFKDIAGEALIDLVIHLLSKGPVYISAYYGKQQEVMDLLRSGGVTAPFIAPEKVYRISKIAEKHGLRIGEVIHENSREAEEIYREGWYIYFTHPMSGVRSIMRRSYFNTHLRPSVIYLSGWLFESLYRSIDDRSYIFSFSDHADFHELIDYIDMARPKMVIIDSFRSGENGRKFAREVKKRLGIRSIALPV